MERRVLSGKQRKFDGLREQGSWRAESGGPCGMYPGSRCGRARAPGLTSHAVVHRVSTKAMIELARLPAAPRGRGPEARDVVPSAGGRPTQGAGRGERALGGCEAIQVDPDSQTRFSKMSLHAELCAAPAAAPCVPTARRECS